MAPTERAAAPGGEPIRVLRIITRLNVGGPSIHVVLLTEGLNNSTFRTTLVTGNPGDQEGDMRYYAREHGVEPVVVPELVREIVGGKDWGAFQKLVRLMRELRPHIVHTHTTKAGVAGRLAAVVTGVPIRVHTLHGHGFEGYYGRLASQGYLWAERWLAGFSDRIVAISETQRDDLCDKYRVVPRERCHVIPLGFDLDHFETAEQRRGEIRRELSWPAGRPLIGIVGRLVPIKNHRMFLDMARLVADARPDAGFVIVGDGELRAELERQVQELRLGEQVRFLGWRRDLDALYADMDVVALTSINEGTPVALIEAMASARPVVSTGVGGVKDVVSHEETGLLVPSGDAAAFAGAVLRLLGDPALRERMGRAGRERAVGRYGSRRLVRDVVDLYLDLLRRRGIPVAPPVARS